MFQFEKNLNLSQRMTNELGKAIIRGDYDEVGGLPTEEKLGQDFGISRSVMREAIKMLSAKGLIISRPRRGILLLPEESWNIFDSDVLSWILDSRPSLLLLKEFLQMRRAIEPEAAALAAKHASQDDIKQIELAIERMQAAELGLDEPLESDIAFHISILYASKNRFFIQLREFVQTALSVSIRHINKLKGINQRDLTDYLKILTAIKTQQSEQAHQITLQLIDEALDLLECELTKKQAS